MFSGLTSFPIVVIKYPEKKNLKGKTVYFGSHFKGLVFPGSKVKAELEATGHRASTVRKQRDKCVPVLRPLSPFMESRIPQGMVPPTVGWICRSQLTKSK